MKVTWDYTELAQAYLKRPGYSEEAIDAMLAAAGLSAGMKVCDVGAGAGHLTIPLAERDFEVAAVEPNEAMRRNGISRTSMFTNVIWHEGTGERTGLPAGSFDLVIYGSSFNVTDRVQALRESTRILKQGGWFACLWNQRDLNDPLQSQIETLIRSIVKNYDYGSRRQDQTEIITSVGGFGAVRTVQAKIIHTQTPKDCLEAWRSHATLYRQAGSLFPQVIRKIEELLGSLKADTIQIPYLTRIWFAPKT